jgi:acetyl esterase/lipase
MRKLKFKGDLFAIFLSLAMVAWSASTSAQVPSAVPATSSATPAWSDVASWDSVHPTITKNIVYANVPILPNPSANGDPGVAGGGAPDVANSPSAALGTMDLHLDVLQVSSSKPTPVVIQLHGGGWIRGSRPGSYKTFNALLAAGMSVVTVDYRLAKDAPAPAAIGDVRCAMAWVKANAAKYNFNLSRVVVYGASAGGHLALMAAYAPASFNPAGCTDQPKVAAVLDFYGPTNLVEGLSEHGSSDFTHQWLGIEKPLFPYAPASGAAATGDGAPALPSSRTPRWAAPNAATLARARQMSPMNYIHAGLPPTFIVNGDHDGAVDPTQDAQLKKALTAVGVPNGQDIVPGGGHGNFSKAESDKAMLLCLQFLKAQGIL